VLAAGLPPSWFEAQGVSIERLRTPYGPLSYAARRRGKSLLFELKTRAPPGGFAIPWPFEGEPGRALINGKEAAWDGGELHVSTAPARVELQQR
jgi:hypothetical protein